VGEAIYYRIKLELLNLGTMGFVGMVDDDTRATQGFNAEVREQRLGAIIRDQLCRDGFVQRQRKALACLIYEFLFLQRAYPGLRWRTRCELLA
jgi:hypothetical protein